MTLAELPVPTTSTKSGKYGPFNQTQREVKTRWVLNPEQVAEGYSAVVVDLTTSHRAESKSFSSALTWATVEKVQRHPSDGPGAVAIESWSSDHRMVGVHRASVARYSVKAMEAHHAEALAAMEAAPERFAPVFEQAAEYVGTDEDA